MVRLQIKTKREMNRRDIPLLSYARDMLKTQDAADMLDNSYFAADLGEDREYIVMDIREYLALVTDGEPTTGGEFDQQLWAAQEYAELMAERLPENAKLVQFALAPIDPRDKGAFERYIRNIHSITEKSPYGQTIVLLRRREESLPYLVLGGHQKVKQVQQSAGRPPARPGGGRRAGG